MMHTIMDNIDMVKSLIEMASSFEDADNIIMEFTDHQETEEKLNFLFQNFDVSVVGACAAEIDEDSQLLITYEAVLTAIVNKKWR